MRRNFYNPDLNMTKNRIFLPVIFIIILFINCATNPITGKRQFMLISEGEELKIGANYSPQVTYEYGGSFKDDELNKYINEVGNKLAVTSHRPELDYHFTVINSSIINAFAVPGGYIYITRGMLDAVHNEAELAGVLGHEIGHITARHSAAQMSKAMGFQYLLMAGLTIDQMYHKSRKAEQIRNVIALGSSVIFQMVSLGYGRENEFQADHLGVEYMRNTRYNPEGMIGVMEIIEKLHDEEPGKLEMLFSSHPKTSERISRIEELSTHFKNSTESANNKENFYKDRFSKKIANLKHAQLAYNHYDKAKKSFSEKDVVSSVLELNEALIIRDDQAPFYKLMGDIYFEDKQYEKAKKEYQKSIQCDTSYVYAYYDIGKCERALNNFGNAEKYYKKAIDLYPYHHNAHLELGYTYYNFGKWQKAAEYLEKSMLFNDKVSDSHAVLGLTYEKLGRYNKAEIEFKKEVALGAKGEYLNISKEKVKYYSKLNSSKR
ncbi:M48 family metalloprotease [candidate division KSB1 bacterium]